MSEFERQWRQRFEKLASRHEAEHLVSGWSLVGLRERVTLFEQLLDLGLFRAGTRVLELGCGAGTYVRVLGKRGHSVVGLDYSLPTLSRAMMADPGRIGRYVAGGAGGLPFRCGAFDAVTCIGVLQTLERPEPVIEEIARVLAPGGVALLETLNPWSPLAAARRLAAARGRRMTKLRYGGPGRLERAMKERGLEPFARIRVVLPPKSAPALAGVLGSPWLRRLLGWIPGVRGIAPHAFWLAGRRS